MTPATGQDRSLAREGPGQPPAISFVIPVRNDAVGLRRCLDSIRRAALGTSVEVLVADNGSTDDSTKVAADFGATVLLLPGLRVSAVRNAGVSSARAPLIAFVDADQELSPDWVAASVPAMADPSVWGAGAEYVSPPDPTWVQRVYDRFRDHAPGTCAVGWLPSGNLIVRRSAFDRVGGFDTTLESCEDVDFCRRLRTGGGGLVSCEGLESRHWGDPKTLRALFFSELWRGRDNLRVSLREPLTLRSAPSVIIPIVDLMAIAGAVLGLLTFQPRGLAVALASLAIVLAGALARSLRLMSRGRISPLVAIHTFAVALTYDVARALALVIRVGHGVRRTP